MCLLELHNAVKILNRNSIPPSLREMWTKGFSWKEVKVNYSNHSMSTTFDFMWVESILNL